MGALHSCARSNQLKLEKLDEPASEPEQTNTGGSSSTPTFPETGINARTLTLTGVDPSSGTYAGGNQVVVRGSGFTEAAVVYFDGRMVQPVGMTLRDSNSLVVIVPAGEPGPASVRVELDEEAVTLDDTYFYSALLIEPDRGAIAGGTSVVVTASGASFDEAVEVAFGEAPCSELRLITPTQLRCKTPPGNVGKVDVAVRWPEANDSTPLTAERAFEYLNPTDTDRGGLSGAKIDGTVNITVVDAMAGSLIPGAFVLLGNDLDGPYRGLTDERGQITFSGEDLEGPVTVHVAGKCLESGSIVAFDAENVTVHVMPLLDPSCGEAGDPPPPGRGTAGALISGELIFPGSDEFAINAWENIPEPRSGEVRVTYVFTTQSRYSSRNPSPGISGTLARVVEETSSRGERGYPYKIFARPAGLAVYAVSGLERRDTGEFMPYAMGVTRDVVAGPGEDLTEIDIVVDIPLDREVQVALSNLPPPAPRGPDQFRVLTHIDLGGQGVIVREVNGQSLDMVTSFTSADLFRHFAQPALVGPLADARYQVIAGWYSGDRDDEAPLTWERRVGVVPTSEPLVIDDLLAIPAVVSPAEGAQIPEDRVLRWEQVGPEPDMYVVSIVGGNNLPAWTQVVPGSQSHSPIPDLSSIENVEDIASGVILWQVQAVRIEDFEYNEFKYNLLKPRYWTHLAADVFTMQR